MRIGHFLTEFPYKNPINGDVIRDYSYGGAEHSIYNISIQLAKLGYNVHIFTSSIDNKDSIENYDRINIFRYGKNFNIGSAPMSLKLLYRPLSHDVDIVHSHLGNLPAPIAAHIYAKKKNKPLIVSYHGDYTGGYGGSVRRLGIYVHDRYIAEKLLSSADIIISPTECYIEESKFLNKFREKIVVIPNGIDIKEYDINLSKEKCRDILKLPQDKKIILFVGSIAPHKGPDVLLKAISKIEKNMRDIKLVFVGTGVMVNELKILSEKLGIKKIVDFVGFVDGYKKVMYYKSSDIFVLPTIESEMFGIVNLEAMACGIPVVASRIGGIPDLVNDGENGLLVHPNDVDSLSDAITYLLQREELCKIMGIEGNKRVENYSLESIAEKMGKIYEDILN